MANEQCTNGRLRELALFAGAGGGILGGKLLGWRTVCAVERDAYAAQVLAQRQNDGLLEAFPIWSDVSNFDGKPWRGIVDVISGGFPCQDISAAGKGAGITGERSGLWTEFARIIGEVRPTYTFIENSPMLTIRGLDTVLSDLAAHGYDAEWDVISAADIGANHKRERIWIVAKRRDFLSYAEHNGARRRKQQQESTQEAAELADPLPTREWRNEREGEVKDDATNAEKLHSHVSTDHSEHSKSQVPKLRNNNCTDIRNADSPYAQRQREVTKRAKSQFRNIGHASWWFTEPNIRRVVNGCAFRVERLKALGNAQVPLCVATAFNLLAERLKNEHIKAKSI